LVYGLDDFFVLFVVVVVVVVVEEIGLYMNVPSVDMFDTHRS
jgi:hypothetical protein